METLIIIAVVIVCFVVGFYLLKYGYVGALYLFAWAIEQGFIGAAAYFACWIFLFPFMLAAVVITGAIICWSS
jgi:ABC-type molybdate transport system permease subunit